MGVLFESMVRFFDDEDWPYARVGGEPALSLAFRGTTANWTCVAQAVEDDRRIFLFYSTGPVDIPADASKFAELVARANHGMLIGNFELDIAAGNIRYKTSLDLSSLPDDAFRPGGLAVAMIRESVYTNVSTMDEYLPAIAAVAEGRQEPAEAIATIEA